MSDLKKIKEILASIDSEVKREDCQRLFDLISEITNEEPRLWRGQMIGFGTYEYSLSNGKSSEWFITGFAPRKNNITIYVIAGYSRYEELLRKLGKFEIGKSCLYINKLSDIDLKILKEIIEEGYQYLKGTYTAK